MAKPFAASIFVRFAPLLASDIRLTMVPVNCSKLDLARIYGDDIFMNFGATP